MKSKIWTIHINSFKYFENILNDFLRAESIDMIDIKIHNINDRIIIILIYS